MNIFWMPRGALYLARWGHCYSNNIKVLTVNVVSFLCEGALFCQCLWRLALLNSCKK